MNNEQRARDRLLKGVMWAVFLWGTILAIGAGLMGVDRATGSVQFAPHPVRGLIVFACVAAFLLSWRILLGYRRQEAGDR